MLRFVELTKIDLVEYKLCRFVPAGFELEELCGRETLSTDLSVYCDGFPFIVEQMVPLIKRKLLSLMLKYAFGSGLLDKRSRANDDDVETPYIFVQELNQHQERG